MEAASAVELLKQLVYKPGWTIDAEDHTHRFEGTVKVRFTFPAHRSERNFAPEGYPEKITTYAEFPIVVADCDDVELYRRVLVKIMEVELHEAREFLRVPPTYWAPFHPHRVDGMKRWGDAPGDLLYGIS
ncbi:hypothetical protein DMH25_46215 [Streptomyces sp. WAC 01325]|uniref:hypothetical protein n=1 Tax=Streptomyces TaxID=1883 RepID=UPI000F86E2A3|nr:hypothetical protein [Streptomyces sp. WAC 01325]RSM83256.1 hypothetical protein DMH25_46215 [Streptomyces sp. WAC 01325]